MGVDFNPSAWTPVDNKSQFRSTFQLPRRLSSGIIILAHTSPRPITLPTKEPAERRFWCIIVGGKKKINKTTQHLSGLQFPKMLQFAAICSRGYESICIAAFRFLCSIMRAVYRHVRPPRGRAPLVTETTTTRKMANTRPLFIGELFVLKSKEFEAGK